MENAADPLLDERLDPSHSKPNNGDDTAKHQKGFTMASDDLIHSSATALVARLAKGEITPLDLLDALEPRIAEVDPQVNALPTLCFERARDHAKRLMAKPVSERGLLQGMPVAIKDL